MPDTYVSAMGGEKLLFLFGNGGSPEEFAGSCSINTDRKLDLSAEVFSGKRANCTDPSKPSKVSRRVTSLDVKFTGGGTADAASHKILVQAWLAGEAISGKIVQDVSPGGYEITGTWVIESIGVGGAALEDQTFDISLATSGDFEFDFT